MKKYWIAFWLILLAGTMSCDTARKLSEPNKYLADTSNKLLTKIDTLELEYVVWGCACANWITPNHRSRFQNSGLKQHCIFIEPENTQLELPLYFDALRHNIKVQGQFYEKEDYPKGMIESEEPIDKAMVFRYAKLEVLDKPILFSKDEEQTLNLTYSIIACSCAQWNDSKEAISDKTNYYYLERADSTLINSDTLWNGNNAPLQIRVTGHVVSEHGFPKGYIQSKGIPDPGKVFRYTKIKVVKNGD
jgi:hypothetical protein